MVNNVIECFETRETENYYKEVHLEDKSPPTNAMESLSVHRHKKRPQNK